jgi:thiol-disulfide isomerase/thioredoxin
MRTVVLALLFAIVAILAYRVWEPFVSSKPAKQSVSPHQANLYFFYTDWCGWSQKAQPEIKKLEDKLAAAGKFGNTKVTLVRVDAEDDREKAELYEVKGYPTILLENSAGIREYTQGVTYDNLIGFLRKTLGEESIDATQPAVE